MFAKIREQQEESVYRQYIGNSIYYFAAKGVPLSCSYSDLIARKDKDKSEETKTGDEIALEIIQKLELKPMNRG